MHQSGKKELQLLQVCDLPLDRVLQIKDKENILEQLIENATKSIGNLIHHNYLHFGENTMGLAVMFVNLAFEKYFHCYF